MVTACRYGDGLVVDEACRVTCSMPTSVMSQSASWLRGWGCFGRPQRVSIAYRCYGLQPGATWRSFCAPSSVDELAAATVAGCRHGLLHDELSCGQWEAVDRRHRLLCSMYEAGRCMSFCCRRGQHTWRAVAVTAARSMRVMASHKLYMYSMLAVFSIFIQSPDILWLQTLHSVHSWCHILCTITLNIFRQFYRVNEYGLRYYLTQYITLEADVSIYVWCLWFVWITSCR